MNHCRLCQYSQKDYQKHVQMDFPYFVSIWAREAELEELRTICDWMNWVRLCCLQMPDLDAESVLLTSKQIFDFDDSKLWHKLPPQQSSELQCSTRAASKTTGDKQRDMCQT